jgi:hypothetical protein
MDSGSAINATIENFLNWANALNNEESAIQLIKQVIESPNIYAFSEIIETPNIAKVIVLFFK